MEFCLKTPAKVNLLLEVGPRRQDGFHSIRSVVDKISLCDTISFRSARGDSVRFVSPWQIPEENTVSAALAAMRKICPGAPPVRITVRKKIPPGAGLGGGSSDAACVIRALARWWMPNIPEVSLSRLAASIGSDVPLFLYPGRALVTGRGERVKVLPGGKPLRYLLALPPFPVETRRVYARWDGLNPCPQPLTVRRQTATMIASLLQRGDWRALEPVIQNSLREASEHIYGQVRRAREMLERRWGKRFFLTGSGGALFCLLAPLERPEPRIRMPSPAGWLTIVAESWTASGT